MSKKQTFWFLLIPIVIGLLASCRSESTDLGVSGAIAPTISADVIRYDQLLHSLPADHLLEGYQELSAKYPAFSELWQSQLIRATTPQLLEEELKIITQDTGYQQLYDQVQSQYQDLTDLMPAIHQTIENYVDVFQFDNKAIPNIYTIISGFAYQAFLFDDDGKNGLGIGLDMFVDDLEYGQIMAGDPRFSNYLTRTYNQEHLVRKIADVLAEDQMSAPDESNLLSFSIWSGKKLYLIDQMIDFVPDSIVMEYTQAQLEWCKENEAGMWQFFFDNDLFYEKDIKKFAKLVRPSPTSPGMPPESPGQTANYIGWQIVKAYMKRNPETSVKDLLLMSAQEMLDKSRYRPVRYVN